MTTKTLTAGRSERNGRDARQLFIVMKVTAWVAFAVGILMCLWNVSSFNDQNMTLMAGTGCLVGSVFIYTIGTLIHLMHKRQMETDSSGE